LTIYIIELLHVAEVERVWYCGTNSQIFLQSWSLYDV